MTTVTTKTVKYTCGCEVKLGIGMFSDNKTSTGHTCEKHHAPISTITTVEHFLRTPYRKNFFSTGEYNYFDGDVIDGNKKQD